jgi:integrase/recombinase XerC
MYVEDFCKWLRSAKGYSEHTVSAYKRDINQLITYLKLDYELSKIQDANSSMIKSYLVSLSEKAYKSVSINRKLASINTYFNYLIRIDVITSNPAESIEGLKKPGRLASFIEEEDLDRLFTGYIKFPEGFEGLRDRFILELLYGTGIRRAELLSLKPSDLNIKSGTLKVTGKGNKQRIVPMHTELRTLAQEYIAERGNQMPETEALIIGLKGNAAYPVMINRLVKKYLSMVTNLAKRSPHLLRHSFATHMLSRSGDINAVKELLGHASLSATEVYTHNTVERLKKIYKQAHPKA